MKLSLNNLALVFSLSLVLSPLNVFGDVYKVVDENGQITYSDNPNGQKIEEVDMRTINTTPAVEPQSYTPSAPQYNNAAYSVSIFAPSNGTEILPGQRDLSISANISPPLSQGFGAQLMLNNQPYGAVQESGNFFVPDIYRGEQKISVVIISSAGKVVARSQEVTVYVIRPIAR